MVPVAPRGHFLVFPLRIPQPRVLQDGKMVRIGAGRREQNRDAVIMTVMLIKPIVPKFFMKGDNLL